jgi:Immunoglobulin-like domain of bacterial spore germination
MRRIVIALLGATLLAAGCGRAATLTISSRTRGLERLDALHGGAPARHPGDRSAAGPRPRPAAHTPGAVPEGEQPAIVVLAPVTGARVHSPFAVSGTADVFEAQFGLRLLDAGGDELVRTEVHASCGTGCRGTYSVSVRYSLAADERGTLEVYQESGQDGSPVGTVRIPVLLSATPDPGEPTVIAQPGSAPVGATVHIEGDGFTGDTDADWIAIEATEGECWVIADATSDVSIDPDGHLHGEFVVPAAGGCHQSVPDTDPRPVIPGTWQIAIGCTACTFGELVVTPS